jgi:hypothetical protein
MLWPKAGDDNSQQDEIRRVLEDRKVNLKLDYIEIRAHNMQVTAFWVVESLGPVAYNHFNSANFPEVFLAYYPENPVLPAHVPKDVPGILKRDAGFDGSAIPEEFYRWNTGDDTDEGASRPGPVDQPNANEEPVISEPVETQAQNNETIHTLFQPRAINMDNNGAWYLSMDSFPPNVNFDEDFPPQHEPSSGKAASVWDDSYGQGQTVYIMENAMDQANQVSSSMSQLSCMFDFSYKQRANSYLLLHRNG